MSILFALLGAFSQALTSVLQRLANIAGSDEKRSVWETTLFLIRQPMWLLGMVCMGGTFVFTALALYFGELATVQPILVTELIFTLALRALWLHDRIASRTWGAAALLCAGLFGFLVVAHPQEGHGHPDAERRGSWPSGAGAWSIVVLLILSRWGSPARRAALLGAAAALVWAIDAAFVKAATEVLAHDGWSGLFVHWPVYAVVVSGVLGHGAARVGVRRRPAGRLPVGAAHRRPPGQHRHRYRALRRAAQQLAGRHRAAGRLPRRHVRRGGPALEVGTPRDGGSGQAVAPAGRVRWRRARPDLSAGAPAWSMAILHRAIRSPRASDDLGVTSATERKGCRYRSHPPTHRPRHQRLQFDVRARPGNHRGLGFHHIRCLSRVGSDVDQPDGFRPRGAHRHRSK